MDRIRRIALAGLLAAALALPAGAEVVCPSDLEQEVADLINARRAEVDLPPLEIDVRLVAAAVRHSEDMADGHFMSHTGSDGSSPFERMEDAGYPVSARGETVGAGYPTPAAMVQGWMNSSGHRAILLGSAYRHVGVGYAPTDWVYHHVWTATFGGSGAPAWDVATHCGPPPAACADGLDNDGDGRVDHGQDPQCTGPGDPTEGPVCGIGFELGALLPVLAWRRRSRPRVL